jgi:hypothetical protein
MKKFTNISGAYVGKEQEKKVDEKQQKIDDFSHQIMKLMDDFLTVRSYGSARPEIMIPVRITGKELFIEALKDLISQEDNKKIIGILESLKSDIHDWALIDNKIDELKEEPRNIKQESKMLQMVEDWGEDKELLRNHFENYKKKLTAGKISEKLLMLEKMINSCEDSSLVEKLKTVRNCLLD